MGFSILRAASVAVALVIGVHANVGLASESTRIFAGWAVLNPGEPPAKNVVLNVADGRIESIETAVEKPLASSTDGSFIDLSCCYVAPGLIDTQVHLESERGFPARFVRDTQWTDADVALRAMVHARRTLRAGFTTIRNMGGHGDAIFAVRDAINAGLIDGPRTQVAGSVIRPTGGELRSWYRPDVESALHDSAICDGPYDCKRAVRAQVALGADTLKVATNQDLGPSSASQFDLEELLAIRQAAHSMGRKVTASAFSSDSLNLPLQAGFDAVVHGTYADDESIERLRETGAFFIPTLVAARTVKEIAEDPKSGVSDGWRAENLSIYNGMLRSFERAREAGVKIAFGTDAGWRPHGGNGEQLVQMVELGMTATDALRSATVSAADAMGMADHVGSLQVGKYADLVATMGNPLDDIALLTSPAAVIKGGKSMGVNAQQDTAAARDEIVTIIHAGQLLAIPGDPPLVNHSIVVRGARIESVDEGFKTSADIGVPNATVVDLSDAFVMPGWIDTHVHLTTSHDPSAADEAVTLSDADLSLLAADNARRVLDAGFTTVMDMGTGRRDHEIAIYAARDAIAQSLIPGPEILAAGSPISSPGASRVSRLNDKVEPVSGPQGVCSGVEDCRRAVREQVYRGADFINFYNTGSLLTPNSPASTFTFAEMQAIVDAANSLNRVAVADGGNTPGNSKGIDDAIKAGADIIDTVTYPGEKTFALLQRSGGYFAPHVYALIAAVGDTPETLSEGSMGWLPRAVLEELYRLKQLEPSAVAGYKAGVNLVLSADSGVFDHGLNAREMMALVALGMAPMDVLAAATINAAKAHGIDHRTGTIEAGKEADIVATGGSPVNDIDQVENVVMVMSDGYLHHQPNTHREWCRYDCASNG